MASHRTCISSILREKLKVNLAMYLVGIKRRCILFHLQKVAFIHEEKYELRNFAFFAGATIATYIPKSTNEDTKVNSIFRENNIIIK